MSRSIHIESHHTIEKLEMFYVQTKCVVFARHIQVIILVKRGYPTKEIQIITSLSANWIYELCKRYNNQGLEALEDQRDSSPGRPPKLNHEELDMIKKNFKSLPLMAAYGLDLKSQP